LFLFVKLLLPKGFFLLPKKIVPDSGAENFLPLHRPGWKGPGGAGGGTEAKRTPAQPEKAAKSKISIKFVGEAFLVVFIIP
jgi:hypothetical protein